MSAATKQDDIDTAGTLELHELRATFPLVPARIISAVFGANLAVSCTTNEAIQASRRRLADALAM
jgi:hypothetical protein